jgi:hypothetical protein
MSTDNQEELCGTIDEAGFLQSLTRQGFNEAKGIGEIKANSIDAEAKNIDITITRDTIEFQDDGNGMQRKSLSDMFAMFKSNHSTDTSLGVSGIGGKVATMKLSEKSEVSIFTYNQNGTYLKAFIPWDKIFSENKYLDMIKITPMSEEEITYFKEKLDTGTGTIIRFPYNDDLRNHIRDNFIETAKMPENINDSSLVIFARFSDVNFTLHDYEKGELTMKKYDYFSGKDCDYYLGKSTHLIKHYYNDSTKDHRFIWETDSGDKLEITKAGSGYSKKLKTSTTNTNEYKEKGEFKVITGQRYDPEVYHRKNPLTEEELMKRFKYTDGHLHCNYDEGILGKLSEQLFNYLVKFPLVRNGQQIGVFPCPDIKPSSARGSADGYHCIFSVRAEVRYNPVSAQDNKQDEIMGIQQNKNQWNPADIPINFSRLVKAIRKEKADQIWNYWIQKSREFHGTPVETEGEPEAVLEPEQGLVPEHELVQQAVLESEPMQEPKAVPEPMQEPKAVPEPMQEPKAVPELLQEPEEVPETMPEPEEVPEPIKEPEGVREPVPEPESRIEIDIGRFPVDVQQHRRGGVYGHELKGVLMQLANSLEQEDIYQHDHLQIYNIAKNLID